MEGPTSHLENAGQQRMELIRGNFKASAIDIDQNMRLSGDEKLEQFRELLRRYEEAAANIPLNHGYQPDAAFELFYGRVEQKVRYLGSSKSGA
jgi:hypothetical protein